MQKKWFSTILLTLFYIGGCIPTNPVTVETPTSVSPISTLDQTRSPVNTSTPEQATATPQEPFFIPVEQSSLELEAQSAILIDAETGSVLYEEKACQQMYPASTTKIMTALLALEYLSPDEIIQVGDEANLSWGPERVDAQKAGLNYGQELRVQELLYGLMLASGSDAAFTIAVNVARRASGDLYLDDNQALADFSLLMNQKAVSIGALETNFVNPDGIQDPHHYTTAYDLALIAQFAMQNRQFRDLVATTIYSTGDIVIASGGVYSRTWESTNRLIQPLDPHYYAPANGIKTGTTAEAGYCLVSSAMVGDHLVIAVVLGSTEEGVWSDSVTLLEYAKEDAQ